MKVEKVEIGRLRADPANARRHERRSIDAIKASLAAYGQQKPVVALPDGTVMAGSGTLAAALELSWTHLDVSWTDLSPERAKAFAVADNRTAETSDWDYLQLESILRSIPQEDLPATGWTQPEIDALLRSNPWQGIDDPAAVTAGEVRPDPSVTWRVRVSDRTRWQEVEASLNEMVAEYGGVVELEKVNS